MASTLSLKKLRDSTTLKSQINQLEEDKEDLQALLEREKKLVRKLQDDLLDQKKDFEHLEKQFDHFANIEAEFEALQQEVQLERLENLVEQEKRENQAKAQLKKAREEALGVLQELKELKKLDPQRLKRQVVDLKKKSASQASENKTLNNALVAARKELKETSAEKEKFEAQYKAAFNESNAFWQSPDKEWALFETGLLLKGESTTDADEGEALPRRVRCVNRLTGLSAVSKELVDKGKDKDLAAWHGDLDIPQAVSKEAGKRLKKIASGNEDESKDKK